MKKNNIKQLLLAVISIVLLPLSVAATPATLSIKDFTISAGETKEMLIDLNNPDTEVTLVQFDLQLPTGLSIAVEAGELAIDIAGRTNWRKHQLTTSDVNGATRFLLASNTNAVLSGTEGALISITLTAGNDFNGGNIKLEGQVIVTPTEEATRPADYTYTLAGSSTEPAAATLSIEDFTISAGETKEMLIDLNNPDTEVTLVQFDLLLPTGLSIAVEDGDLVFDIAGRTTWRKHQLSTSDVNGATRFLLASSTNAVLSGTSGAVISIMLTAGNDFNGGDIKLEGQVIVTPTEEAIRPADYTYTLAGKVKCATPTINIANGKLDFSCETEGVEYQYEITSNDAKTGTASSVTMSGTYTVSVYATKEGLEDSDVATLEFSMGGGMKGDVNGDSRVDIADVTAVINIINQ